LQALGGECFGGAEEAAPGSALGVVLARKRRAKGLRRHDAWSLANRLDS
jgi:hypothetical protein